MQKHKNKGEEVKIKESKTEKKRIEGNLIRQHHLNHTNRVNNRLLCPK